MIRYVHHTQPNPARQWRLVYVSKLLQYTYIIERLFKE